MSQANNAIPDEKIWCHRTNFQEKCQDMVVKKQCPLWVRLAGTDMKSGGALDLYGCADTFGPQIATQSTAQLSQMLQTVAGEVNALRLEVQGQQLQAIGQAIVGVNKTMREVQQIGATPDQIKLLVSGGAN